MHVQPSYLFLLPVTLATHLRITIPSTPILHSPATLPPSTTALLQTLSSHLSAPLRSDNTFDFRNVSTGSYLLDVSCATHGFAPLRVDVSSAEGGAESVEVWGTFRGNEWGNKGEVTPVTKTGGKWEFEVKPGGVKEYLVERSGFSPLSILKNPMILIAIASMGVVFGMPYLMENMDPEMKAELEERQKSGGATPANPLQDFDAAAWLAGTKKKAVEVAEKAEKSGKVSR